MTVPVCLDAERRVLGTLIVFHSAALLQRVRATGLQPEHFWWRSHEAVYRAILRLDRDSQYVDGLVLGRFLAGQRHPREGSWLEAVGGQVRVDELAAYADANGCVPAALMIVEDAKFRRWLTAMQDGIEAIYARDDERFWLAMGRVREDASATGLRVISGDDERKAA